MIHAATAAAPADRTAALDALATELQDETRERTPVLSGEIHTPRGASDKAVQQLAQEIAALSVVAFGLVALWRGPEWALEQEEAELIGDATAEPYADEAEELARKVKWFGPAMALAGIVGRKAIAEAERKRAQREAPPRAPGTGPAGG